MYVLLANVALPLAVADVVNPSVNNVSPLYVIEIRSALLAKEIVPVDVILATTSVSPAISLKIPPTSPTSFVESIVFVTVAIASTVVLFVGAYKYETSSALTTL